MKNIFDVKYQLSVCEDCLTNRFPEYKTFNKSRVFNKLGDVTIYAFGIPIEIAVKWKKQNYAITLENLVMKHGDIEGSKIWNNYLEKQSLTNTFEYKKEKYGWDEEKFKEYNLSRSVTIENMVKKHGEKEGLKLWDNYTDRQKYTCSKEYFIKEYGEKFGLDKFENFSKMRSFNCGYSKISILFFDELIKKLYSKNYTIFYQDNEYFFNIDGNFYLVDFFIKELNLVIEFNGDAWHANPKIYKEEDIPIKFNEKFESLKAKVIWERDTKKLENLKTKVRDVIIVWEKDLTEKGIDKLTEELVKKIKLYE